MDTSNNNMDPLDDSSTLPELSFDDLLDSSPIKKNGKSAIDDDPLEFENERCRTQKDDTLNTPGPKRPQMSYRMISSKATPVRTNPVKAGNPLTASFSKHNNSGNGGNSSGPILLNSKNVLPKMATQITNNSIKITPKSVSSTAGSGGVMGTAGSNVSMAGKTAVRTSSGQLIYIQKNSLTSSSSAIKSGNTINMKQQASSVAGGSGGGNKPVTIQVVRNADGNFVPLKSATGGSNGKNTTLTLSPTTTLAGKKIVTSSGGQVLIKNPTSSSAGSNQNTSTKTMVKSVATTSSADLMAKPKTIYVQSSSGKQIVLSSQHLMKLSPKVSTTIASVSSSTTSSGSGSGQVHAIQIPGKGGVQYVRVMPSSKVSGKPVTVSQSTTTTSLTKTVNSSSTSTLAATSSATAPVKILNNLPQKFTVVQKGGGKVVVTQKKEPSDIEFSPIASKVHKTIVTMPSLRPINDEKSKMQQQSLIKSQHATANPNAVTGQSLIRKHKISEINSEIKRITATDSEDSGPPEIKKAAPNNRVVVISSNAPKILLNNSMQQPSRVANTMNSSFTSGGSGSIQVQGTKSTPSSTSFTTSASTSSEMGNKLYTILKPTTSGQQHNQTKLFSVLKTSNVSSMATTSQPSFTTSSSTQKTTLFNKQFILQQQQKIFHLKQLQKSKISQFPATSSTSPTYLPLKIKEEPLEFIDTSTTATEKAISSSSSFISPSTAALQPLSMVSTVLLDDPDKMDLVGGVRRKHCNCSKSQCLKLYCDCFANGEFCQDCTCKDCFNNLENEDERQRAIKSCLERNPSAFKPKITSSSDQGDMRLHNKGCNCKRSGCLKNYCECYEAKIPCSSNCKCVGCRNVEDRPDLDMDPVDPKLMASMANVAAMTNSQKRNYEKAQRDAMGNVAIKSEKFSKDGIKTEISSTGGEANSDTPQADKQQCNFITQEVVDATIQCMITQADECEKNGLPAYQMEKMVMEELGRCLVEIIDFSIRNTDTSYSQD